MMESKWGPCRTIALSCILISALMALPQPVSAQEWVTIHGTSGHLENPSNVESGPVYYGWGLDFDLKSGLTTWIHYAVPSVYGMRVQFIALEFYTGSVDAWVSNIDVYNGGTKIHTLVGTYSGNQLLILNLGSKHLIDRALGISLRTAAGVEMMSHRVIIYTVGALTE